MYTLTVLVIATKFYWKLLASYARQLSSHLKYANESVVPTLKTLLGKSVQEDNLHIKKKYMNSVAWNCKGRVINPTQGECKYNRDEQEAGGEKSIFFKRR